MQTNLKLGKATSRVRGAGLSVVIVAGASVVATFSFFVPNSALAACVANRPAGVQAASTGSGGLHTATGIAAPSGTGGGSGSLGCPNGRSASALRGLPTTASGRIVEPDAHAARPQPHKKATPTQSASAAAHSHPVKPAHHG